MRRDSWGVVRKNRVPYALRRNPCLDALCLGARSAKFSFHARAWNEVAHTGRTRCPLSGLRVGALAHHDRSAGGFCARVLQLSIGIVRGGFCRKGVRVARGCEDPRL